MIELRTLGRLDLRDPDGRELRSILSPSKRIALLAYLALATPRGFHRRDTLLALFWPELDQEHARLALRQTLYRIRHTLTDGTLVNRGEEEIGIDSDRFWCDAAAFEALLDDGRVKEALEVYRGDLLAGFYLSGCVEFERWLDGERARLKERAARAAWSLAEGAEASGNAVEAAHWGRRAAAFAPADEEAVRRLVALLDRLGDRAGAIREYDAFATRLREDYEVEPAPETQELIETVRARAEANGSVVPALPAAQLVADERETARHEGHRRWPSWLTRRIAVVGSVALAVLVVVGAAIVVNPRGSGPPLDPTRVLVDIFQNETGDPSLDRLGRLSTDRVTAGLTYTTFVDVVSLGTPLLSRQPVAADTALLEQGGRLQALARANGTGTVVWGSYYLYGDSVHFHGHVTNAGTGEELATIEPVRGSVDAPVSAIEQLRDRVMTTLATLTDPRLAKWARYASKPPTFDAYQAFVEGIELFTHERDREAIPHFLRAASIDSSFTMPLLWAIAAYRAVHQRSAADSLAQALDRRREQLAPLDRHWLDYHLAGLRRDRMGALRAVRRLVEIAPNSEYLELAASAALWVNHPREAVEFLTRVDPESGWLRGSGLYWWDLAAAYHMLGDHRMELEAVRRGLQQSPGNIEGLFYEMQALAALGRLDEVNASIENLQIRMPRRGGSGAHMLSAARELRAHSHRAAASDLVERAVTWYQATPWYQGGQTEGKEWQRLRLADALSMAGRLDEARAILEQMMQSENLSDAPLGGFSLRTHTLAHLAVVSARQGDREEALRISRLLEDEDFTFGWRASIAAALGDRERAVALLREQLTCCGGYANLHKNYEPLWDYPPFQELIRPKG